MSSIDQLSTKEAREFAKVLELMSKKQSEQGPKTDDELHAWVKKHMKIDIPRTSVCDGHVAPFTFLADLYFERTVSAIAMANRGGSKTMLAALWLFLCSKFRPGCESASVASESQTMRAYDHLKRFIMIDGDVGDVEKHPEIERSVMRKTEWKNRSLYEIIIATIGGVNGPHPQKMHADEVELMDPEVLQEAFNMAVSKQGILAQEVLTSTRKRAHGLMQSIIDEVYEAERIGKEPPYKLYQWCCFETAMPVKECQVADPSLPPHKRCGCDQVVKGKWDDGTPRTFKDVCGGRLARAGGWMPLSDVYKNFKKLSQDVWEAQQECIKPSAAGLVFPMFARERECIKWYDPDPANGPIFMSVDFGSTNPSAVEWMQVLRRDVYAHGYHQTRDEEPKLLLKEGSRVVFDEIYLAELSPLQLADMVIRLESGWRQQHPGWKVIRRFYDVQAKGARLEWARHTTPLQLVNFASKDPKGHIPMIRELIMDDRLYIDIRRCPMLVENIEAWHYPKKRSGMTDDPEVPVKDFDHAIDAYRYMEANYRAIEKANRKGHKPGSDDHEYGKGGTTSIAGSGPSRYLARQELAAADRWK